MLCQVVVTSTQGRSVIGVDASLRVVGALCQRRTTRTARRTARPTLDALWHERLSNGRDQRAEVSQISWRTSAAHQSTGTQGRPLETTELTICGRKYRRLWRPAEEDRDIKPFVALRPALLHAA